MAVRVESLLVVLLLCFVASAIAGPWSELPVGEYEIRDGTLLSQDWTIATVNFDIDKEELAFPVVVPCFECVPESNYEKADDGLPCVCDFASKDHCGTAPKGCPKSTCDPDLVEERCSFKKNPLLKDWTEISVKVDKEEDNSVVKGIEMQKNEVKYFRFTARDPCRGYKVKTMLEFGFVDLLVSLETYQPTEVDQQWSTASPTYPDHIEVDYCPEFYSFKLVTVYVTAIARSDVKFDLHLFHQLSTIDEPPTGVTTNDICENDPLNHICIQPGVPTVIHTIIDDNRFVYFRYDLKVKKGECKTITVYADAEWGDCGIGGDFNITTPNYYGGPTPEYISEYSGSDIHHFQRCFEEDGVVPYYFGIYCWSPGTFVIRVSENKGHFLLPTTEIPQYQYSYTATKAIWAKCPGTSSPLNWMCDDWRNFCTKFWLVYPAEDPQPFWPTPNYWRSTSSPISSAMFSDLVHFDNPLRNQRPGSISVVMVLSLKMFGRSITYLNEEELSNCTFYSKNTLFTKKGYAVQGSAPIQPKKPKCDRKELEATVKTGSQIVKKLQTANNFDTILQHVFEINSLMYSTPWLTCSNYADSLMDIEEQFIPTMTTACLSTNTSSPEYINDPCCNSNILWKSCCLPRLANTSTEVILAPNTHIIDKECSYSECTTSYVSELVTLEANSFQCATFSSDQYPELINKSFSQYVNCKTRYNIDAVALGQVECHSHAECSFGGFNSKCNFITSRCIPSRALEVTVVECFIDALDIYNEFYFKELFGLPGRKSDKDFINRFIDAVTTKNCRNNYGHQTTLQQSENFMVIDEKCSVPYNCNQDPCLDSTCIIQPTTCIAHCQMFWTSVDSSEAACKEAYKCNWMGDECRDSQSKCEKECENSSSTKDSFCAYCFDDAHCVEIPNLDSKADCENTEVCLLPDGTLELMSEEECKQVHKCTQPCYEGMSCHSGVGADNTCYSSDTEDSCTGIWRSDISLCTFPLLGQDLCEQSGYEYFACSALSLDECSACFNGDACPVNQTAFQCKVRPTTECSTKSDCESYGGLCNDALYYHQAGRSTDDFGACLTPFKPMEYSGALPLCNNGDVTPQGCLGITYVSQSDCAKTVNAYWHSLASSKNECLSYTGCQSFNQINVLSNLDYEECKACGHDTTKYYAWTEGKWITATSAKLQWQTREVLPLYQWAPTIDFPLIQSRLEESIQATVFSDLRSQAMCDFNLKSQLLGIISCACSDGKHCFNADLSSVQIGSGRPCIGLGSTIQNSLATIEIADDAVSQNSAQRCVDVTLEPQSIYSLQQPEQAPFSPLTKVREYDDFNVVLNDDNAIIGRVMSDGLKTTLSGKIDSFLICLQISEYAGSAPSSFDEWDLGTPSSDDKSFLNPMGLHSNNRTISSTAIRYCFEINNPSLKETYFLVLREKNYENKDGSLYGSEAAAWWTFAAIYTVLAILTFLTYVLHFFGYPLHFYFLGLFLFLSGMCIIRAVYFYCLAAQVFDNGSALAVAYFLIEFPTLLYFTAFSCLGAFWIFLLYAHQQSKAQKYILGVLVAFSSFLYLLFVVLLILFQTLLSTTDSECPDRIPAQNDNTRQQIISIFYQSFMAGVSLLLALWVAITGARLLIGLKKKQFERKVGIVTFLCAAGLLLHCAFILYLSIAYVYNFTIIVLMIVLSELVPIFFITIQFSFLRRKQNMPSYNKRARFLKALFMKSSSGSTSTATGSSKTKNTSTTTATRSAKQPHSSSEENL